MLQITTPDFRMQPGVTTSPFVFANAVRYRRLSFQATTITKVEVALTMDDSPTWIDITGNTGLLNTTTAGLAVIVAGVFVQYRVTFTGTLVINAN